MYYSTIFYHSVSTSRNSLLAEIKADIFVFRVSCINQNGFSFNSTAELWYFSL